MLRELWLLRRRLLLTTGAITLGLVVALVGVAVVIRASGGAAHRPVAEAPISPLTGTPMAAGSSAAAGASSPKATTGSPAADVPRWNAMPAITPATSRAFPAVPAADRADPAAFARAFVTELFTRTTTTASTAGGRAQLIAWAQAEDAPLRSPNYPVRDWSKVLLDSLTDLTWDQADQTPIPPVGDWLAAAHDNQSQQLTDVATRVDPVWETKIADGYQPPDPLTTIEDVTGHLDVRTGRHHRRTVYAISLAVQLGTAAHGGYGAACTNNYVIRQVS